MHCAPPGAGPTTARNCGRALARLRFCAPSPAPDAWAATATTTRTRRCSCSATCCGGRHALRSHRMRSSSLLAAGLVTFVAYSMASRSTPRRSPSTLNRPSATHQPPAYADRIRPLADTGFRRGATTELGSAIALGPTRPVPWAWRDPHSAGCASWEGGHQPPPATWCPLTQTDRTAPVGPGYDDAGSTWGDGGWRIDRRWPGPGDRVPRGGRGGGRPGPGAPSSSTPNPPTFPSPTGVAWGPLPGGPQPPSTRNPITPGYTRKPGGRWTRDRMPATSRSLGSQTGPSFGTTKAPS